ncbi:hypothetical protein [Flavobacterium hungaricum]|uniref:Lipoprotein n=1 Tax=Flavobacterium hungaricum TaxID=2082725 RepID=A0ABR9TKL1_9FLAO|nr:hypothetical protein [Flavobacterium hungaricum]MBE8725911.1 hypothetical protein [Flavobacterium hungaricum]
MRKFITIFILACSIVSCNSDDAVYISPEIYGKWDWTGTGGGIAAHIKTTPESTKSSMTLIIAKNKTFSILQNGKEIFNGNFEIRKEKSIHSGKEEDYINFDVKELDEPIYFTTRGIITVHDGLILNISDNNYDGLGSSFKRIK